MSWSIANTKELKCKNCKPPERHPGCHGTCQHYIEWKKKYEEINKKYRKQKYIENL